MSKAEKTLVILTPGFPKDESDTTCLPMQQTLVRSIKENYPHINIIILSFQYPYFKKEYTWFDTTVISFNGQNKGGLPRLLLRRQLYAALRRIKAATEIVGLLSFWYGECAAIGQEFAEKHGLKHFCWLLGQDAKRENKYPRRLRLKPGDLVALSDFLQDEFEKNHGVRPQYVIPPGIDPKLFGPLPVQKDIDILGAGSLIPLKQYNILVDIIAEIKKQIPDINAVLIGDGLEKQKLQALITHYKLESNITLAGELRHAEVLQLMQRTKVFLHTSSYEGFGVVLVEALYAGCHVVSFNRAMFREIVQWNIVNSKEQMIEKAMLILNKTIASSRSVTFCTIDDVSENMMNLFKS